jgi:hypothetical protein
MEIKTPANRALAMLNTAPPTEPVTKAMRITNKVRRAVDLLVNGECKQITEAAARVGLARESLGRALARPHVAEHMRQKVIKRLNLAGAVKPLAAGAAHPAVRLLRRQQFAAFPHRIFLGDPVASVTPALKMRLDQRRQERLPCGLKVGARQVEGLSRAVPIFPDLGSWVEAEDPAPLIDVDWSARAERDRADMDIAVIDVPAIAAFGVSAAGELGHAPLKRDPSSNAPISGLCVPKTLSELMT